MRSKPVAPASALALLLTLCGLARVLPERAPPPRVEGEGRLVPDLNRSPTRHLVLLPGIGPARAAAIVEERVRGGPFAGLPDLARVPGIGPTTAGALEGAATAGGPSRR